MHHLQPQVAARRDDHARLRLRRIEGRRLGADQGHHQHLARPDRLRPICACRTAQLLRRYHRRRYLLRNQLHLGLPGKGHRLRRRQEAGQADHRNRDAVSALQGRFDPVRVPDRADRRRHRSGRQEVGAGARQAGRSGALRGLSRRLAVARSPHRQRLGARLDHLQPRRQTVRKDPVRRRHPRRLQHRRRRLGVAHPA